MKNHKKYLKVIVLLVTVMLINMLFTIRHEVDSAAILGFPAGYSFDEETKDHYYYDELMVNWTYYNPYILAYISFNEDWKETDGWKSVYLEDMSRWYWCYYDKDPDVLYHFNESTSTWYYFSRKHAMWIFMPRSMKTAGIMTV